MVSSATAETFQTAAFAAPAAAPKQTLVGSSHPRAKPYKMPAIMLSPDPVGFTGWTAGGVIFQHPDRLAT
jgi:hypothetical protein